MRGFYRHDDSDFVPIPPSSIALWCLKAIRRQRQKLYLQLVKNQKLLLSQYNIQHRGINSYQLVGVEEAEEERVNENKVSVDAMDDIKE